MIRCIITDITDDLIDTDAVRSLLDPSQLRKADSYIFSDDRKRCIGGILLAMYSAVCIYGMNTSDICFSIGEHGKPYIMGSPFKYSISHSGRYAVISFGRCESGIDIEKISSYDAAISDNYFSDNEKNMISSGNSGEIFCSIWTCRESYVKWKGCGMLQPLESYSTEYNGKYYRVCGCEDMNFRQYYDYNGYVISVCSEDKIKIKLRNIEISELIRELKKDQGTSSRTGSDHKCNLYPCISKECTVYML